jgi:hypothetical protein
MKIVVVVVVVVDNLTCCYTPLKVDVVESLNNDVFTKNHCNTCIQQLIAYIPKDTTIFGT